MKEKIKTANLSILVYDSICVSEIFVVALIIKRIGQQKAKSNKDGLIISVDEYRKIVNDFTSSPEHIKERIQYLEAFCRNIIKISLNKIYEKE